MVREDETQMNEELGRAGDWPVKKLS